VNFVMLRPEAPFRPVLDLINGEFVYWHRSRYAAVVRVLRASDLVICRNYHASFFAIVAKFLLRARCRVHADLRGVVPEEALADRSWPLNYVLYAAAKIMEWAILRHSTSISCVCEPFREYAIERGANPATTTVVWNGADIVRGRFDAGVRAAVRKKLGFDDNLVFVFSGSASTSGRFERMLRLFRSVHDANPRARLLILTRGTAAFQRLCSDVGVTGCTILRCDPHQVPAHLMAADYAFLLRKEDVISRCAYPMKFAEYLAAGNKIVISQGIGVCSAYVLEKNAGIVLDAEGRDEAGDQAALCALRDVPLAEKERIAALAAADLDRDVLHDRYLASLGL